MGTTIIFLEISSTIRDFPVPDEFIIFVCLEYGCRPLSRKFDIVRRSTWEASPLYARPHARSVSIIGQDEEIVEQL